MLSRLFKSEDEDSGFLPRFILIIAEAEMPAYWSNHVFSEKSVALLRRIAAHLWDWDIEYDAGHREIKKVIQATQEAIARYIQWYNSIAEEAFLSNNGASFLRKLQAHALRICLLLHCLDAAVAGNDGMSDVTEDTMRRALLLADWVKKNQGQCLQFFRSKTETKPADPVEREIMRVVVAAADQIEASGWRIKFSELYRLVEEKLNISGLRKDHVARAASALGLTPCFMQRERARKVPEDAVASFKKAVAGVAGVVPPTAATAGATIPPVADPLPGVVASLQETVPDYNSNTRTTVDVVDESLAAQGQTTSTTSTAPTSPAGDRNFDFDAPDFPDVVTL
jgi:hypothetical protein